MFCSGWLFNSQRILEHDQLFQTLLFQCFHGVQHLGTIQSSIALFFKSFSIVWRGEDSKGTMEKGCGCVQKSAAEFSPVWAREPAIGLSFLLLYLNLLCLNLSKAQRNCWKPTYLLVAEFTGLFILGKFP